MSASHNHNKRNLEEETWDNASAGKRSRSSGTHPSDPAADDHYSRVKPETARSSGTTTDLSKVAVITEKRKEDLTEWISGRLQEHVWNDSVRKQFREKLSAYQAVQINGHEKNLTELLVKNVGLEARSKLPDDIKQDLVAAVQDFLQEKDEFLQYYKRTRRRGQSSSSR